MYLEIACRSVLLAVFVVAFAGKLPSRTSYRDFAESLRPMNAAGLAPVVVGAELLVVALLAAGLGSVGYPLAGILLVAFVIGIVRSLRADVPVTCRCFGGRGGQLGRRHVVRNVLLAVVAVAGMFAPQGTAPTSVPTIALAAGTGLLASLVFIGWDELAYLVGVGDGSARRT